MARRKGFEPPTFWFVAKHSIQLSYRRIYERVRILRTLRFVVTRTGIEPVLPP